MSTLPRVSGHEVMRALGKIGFVFDRQHGSHIVLLRTAFPRRRVVVPDHREIAKGTLRAILRQVELDVDQFRSLL